MVYDTAGNLLRKKVTMLSNGNYGGNVTNSYDSWDDLKTSVSAIPAQSFNDSFNTEAGGNLNQFKSTSVNKTFNNRNEFTMSGFAFDSNGNPTTYSTSGVPNATLTFDPENHMTSFKNGSTTVMTATYRSDGLRASKTSGSTTTYYIYGIDGTLLLEIQGGSVTAANTVGPNGLISRRSGGSTAYYSFDERGNTLERYNSTSGLDLHATDEYGNSVTSASTSDPYQGFGAQFGYYLDSETGLYLLGQRYFDPNQGRFLNQDPIGIGGGVNLYAYCSNNPIMGADPSGLFDWGQYWHDVGQVFVGYGQALNPVNWVKGGVAAYQTIRANGWQGVGQVGIGMIQGLEFWNADDPADFGARFMNVLMLAAPIAKGVGAVSKLGTLTTGAARIAAITERLTTLAEQAADIADQAGLTTRQAAAVLKCPRLAKAFRGSNINAVMRRLVEADPMLQKAGLNTTQLFQPLPDFTLPGFNGWWDLTTAKAWPKHVTKYGPGGIHIPYP